MDEWEYPDQELHTALYHMRTRKDLSDRQKLAFNDIFVARLKRRKATITFKQARREFARAFHPNQHDAEIQDVLSGRERTDAWNKLNYYMGYSSKAQPVAA